MQKESSKCNVAVTSSPKNLTEFQQALSFHQRGQLEQAEILYKTLLQAQPQHTEALHFLGVIAAQRGQNQTAIELISQSINIEPNNFASHSNIGNAFLGLKRYEEALASYDRTLNINPNHADTLYNRGIVLQELKRYKEALISYDHALAIKPNYIEALNNRGNVLKKLKRYHEALASYDRTLSINPDFTDALSNRALVLKKLKRYDEAIDSYGRILSIKPDYEFLFGVWLHTKMQQCNWTDFNNNLDKLEQGIERGDKISQPFAVLSLSSSAALQKKVTSCYAQSKYPSRFLAPPLTKHAHKKIKIGYFSADFRHHAVSYLMAELFERHDRSRFEVIAFSLHITNNKDDMRLRLERVFDQFIDVSQQSDEQIVRLARQLEIDIAIDLNGFTNDGRADLFAMRVAPIQVNYLGYPATMGVEYMDYLLADSVLIPTEYQTHYSEKIAYLPNSYMVNDSTRTISNRQLTRAEFGLPEQGFVFCCFNNTYKITPKVFACWMRLLHRVDGSVLWLSKDNSTTVSNLQRAATALGINAERIIFAERLPLLEEHLARHRLADLFLDTQPYNAHTTTSDSLWAGLPVLTCLSETFAGRVAASLLHAIGLPELVTTTLEDYEAWVFQLATHPEQLAALKQKLADSRLTYPLFNTKLFTQHIESAFQIMFDRYQADLAPEHIYIPVQPVKIEMDEFQQAQRFFQQGQFEHAETLYKTLLQTQPQHADALHFLGVIAYYRGQYQAAIDFITHSLTINPNNSAAHSNRGLAFQGLKRYHEALASYDRALAINPNLAETLSNRGNVLQELKRYDQALVSYDRALSIKPEYVNALSNRGSVLNELKRYDQALASYDRALSIKPNYVEALSNCGLVLQKLKRYDEALAYYDRALNIKPDHAETFFNRGNVLKELNRYEEAIANYNHALNIKPNYAEALFNRGIVLKNLNRYDQALASYDRALKIEPDYKFLFGDWLHIKMKLCDWTDFERSLNTLEQGIERGDKISQPFPVLALSSSAALQKKVACCYAQTEYPSHVLAPPLTKHTHTKIKIGYFSADFRNHPVAYLMAELFERHDRSRFEVIAFSFYNVNSKDDMRLRLERVFDQFIDVSKQSDEQVAQLARQLEIDIAIDLHGFTANCRTNLFAMRVAPIQVNYLGYPATMGADYIDYLLADCVLIPKDHQPYYTEKIAYLPNSYMVNDTNRPIANRLFTRAEFGLPEQGFVFCCFNNAYKITPKVFAIWMQLLHQIGGSVLWLSKDNITAANNLRRAATAQGINAERIIFAERLPALSEHLARHRLADLFLDTSPYNAHTTTSDALWSGLPVLTCIGETFASRVAASLLNAIGLPELITNTPEDYQALAIQLATHPEQLATIKQKLANNRLTTPLFNTALFTQHIESAYQTMFDRYQANLTPEHIYSV